MKEDLAKTLLRSSNGFSVFDLGTFDFNFCALNKRQIATSFDYDLC